MRKAATLISLIAVATGIAVYAARDKEPQQLTYAELPAEQQVQVDCLAKNIYYEAAGEPHEGRLAVGLVTMNRLQSGTYAKSVCGVVYQKRGKAYQFSWVGMQKKMAKMNVSVYQDVQELATIIYTGNISDDITEGATFYHATYVKPRWKNVIPTKQIGKHKFYREDI